MTADLPEPPDGPAQRESCALPPPPEPGIYEASTVRPYARTGGRTRANGNLPIEALVSSSGTPTSPQTAEKLRILELSGSRYLSIAELSAHVRLPVGVVRVIVGDLVDEGLARVHGHGPATLAETDETDDPALTLSVLESVLNGISAL